MGASVKLLQIVRFALLGSIVLYMIVMERVAHASAPPAPVFFYAITFAAIMTVGMIFVLRRILIAPVEAEAGGLSPASLVRWRAGYIVTYALSEAVALFGFVLGILGYSLTQVAPFFVAGIVLILFFGPGIQNKQ
jgi:hypothetical protein